MARAATFISPQNHKIRRCFRYGIALFWRLTGREKDTIVTVILIIPRSCTGRVQVMLASHTLMIPMSHGVSIFVDGWNGTVARYQDTPRSLFAF